LWGTLSSVLFRAGTLDVCPTQGSTAMASDSDPVPSTAITAAEPETPLASMPPETPTGHQPYVPDHVQMPELTWSAVLVGALLGIIFGASSLYLVLKVGMTVSASVPIAVLSITLFRAFSKLTGFRRATILENNIVQTTGSAGESIAFGVGVTMPALLLLGFEMDVVRVMTVSVLGGLLGILMMIPLRRAFIVKQHGKLTYPEGTACAEVLIAGEKGGATARMVFVGFGIALVHKFFTAGIKFWSDTPGERLYTTDSQTGVKSGLKGAEVSGELSPELLGVGFLIGPRIACLMLAGAVLSYFVLGPLIAQFGDQLTVPVSPAQGKLIRDMEPSHLKANYLRYIGAGAVAAGGIISMCRALPLIFGSIVSGLRDLRATAGGGQKTTRRTERDMSMAVVLFGSIGMVIVMMCIPALGLGISLEGFLGALMILVFGFLFVTVSSRLTGEIGSSSNPISGMTIATLLLTCVIFFIAGKTEHAFMLTALTVAAVVCIASSNGGTTSQDLKTGFLIGATPRPQQYAILVGALTSALVIGGTMLFLNWVGTHYTMNAVPESAVLPVPGDAPQTQVGKPYDDTDTNTYRIVHLRKEDAEKINSDQKIEIKPGRYLVDAAGHPKYRTDIPIAQETRKMDRHGEVPKGFTAPQPQLFSSIIEGILGGTLEWGLFGIGSLIAIAMELAGVRALPFAVGMYLPISVSTPIFAGGMLRWLADKLRGVSASEAETETSPGVLLSSGYIAGGTVCGLLIAFLAAVPAFNRLIDLAPAFGESRTSAEQKKEIANFEAETAKGVAKLEQDAKAAPNDDARREIENSIGSEKSDLRDHVDSVRRDAWIESGIAKVLSLIAFGALAAILLWQGLQRPPKENA
jgi:putative OPT family oligopeptide transporter